MIKGETVILRYQGAETDKDAFGSPVYTEIEQEVGGVLVQPVDTQDDPDSNRPDGITIRYRLLFPKLFVYGINPEIFRGAETVVRGKVFRVIGEPGYYDAENCPTEWAMSVYVGAADG